ncbi:hypothetical protein SPPN_11180 [Streptococcus pseudopneumoniae IS7493]|nr:hypothetical protein SPPN_11180 [Streptococcus pseudopneumoniae IS7493]
MANFIIELSLGSLFRNVFIKMIKTIDKTKI